MAPLTLQEILTKYPRLTNLVGKVPSLALEHDLAKTVHEYETIQSRARTAIPTVNLSDVIDEAAESGRIVLDDFLGRWGNVSVEELCKLCLAASWLRPQAVFEFGTYNGLTTRQLAINVPDALIYTLDIDPAGPDAAALQIGAVDEHLARKSGDFSFTVGHKFHNTHEQGRISQLWGNSLTFDYRPFVGKVNLVFIDAGHTYDYVSNDSRIALHLLDARREGLIVWHDYDQVLHPGVTRCLVELAESGHPIRHLRNTHMAMLRVRPHS